MLIGLFFVLDTCLLFSKNAKEQIHHGRHVFIHLQDLQALGMNITPTFLPYDLHDACHE